MKLLVINSFGVESPQSEKDFCNKVASDGTELSFRHVGKVYPFDHVTYGYYRYKCAEGVIETIVQAEKEGFDGAVINCTYDPGLIPVREIVDIPVVGCFEAALHYACMVGNKYSVVTVEAKVGAWHEFMIRMYGVTEKFCSVKDIGIPANRLNPPYHTKDEVIDLVLSTCKRCVTEDRADVVVFGCTFLSSLLAKEFENPSQKAGIAVIDPLAVAIKTAEMRVELLNKTNLPAASRVSFYRKPPQDELQSLRDYYAKGLGQSTRHENT